MIKKCADNGIAGQHFTVYWYEWDKIFLLLRGSLDYAITGDPEPSDPETFKLYISYLTSRDALWSLFAVALAPKAHTKQSSFSIIENISKTTINAKGHKIGQRDGLSKQDIIQLQLLYQCPSGPRNINSFCSTDCKCRYGQGECTSNDQCEAGLKCMSVSKSMKKCLTSSPTPTNTPTKLPTQNPISLSPTAVPTLVCSYTKKAFLLQYNWFAVKSYCDEMTFFPIFEAIICKFTSLFSGPNPNETLILQNQFTQMRLS